MSTLVLGIPNLGGTKYVIKDITGPLLKCHCQQSSRKIMLLMIQKSTSCKTESTIFEFDAEP